MSSQNDCCPLLVRRLIAFPKSCVFGGTAAVVTRSSVAYSAQTHATWSSLPSGIVVNGEAVIAAPRQSQSLPPVLSEEDAVSNSDFIPITRRIAEDSWTPRVASCMSTQHKSQRSYSRRPEGMFSN